MKLKDVPGLISINEERYNLIKETATYSMFEYMLARNKAKKTTLCLMPHKGNGIIYREMLDEDEKGGLFLVAIKTTSGCFMGEGRCYMRQEERASKEPISITFDDAFWSEPGVSELPEVGEKIWIVVLQDLKNVNDKMFKIPNVII